jgi:hypothetical protein
MNTSLARRDRRQLVWLAHRVVLAAGRMPDGDWQQPERRAAEVRYATAVRRLLAIAETCDQWSSFQGYEPELTAAYTYGPVLDAPGADLEVVHVALVVLLPAELLPWGVEPPECSPLVHTLGLDKTPVVWRWRPAQWPVGNHEIRRPLPIWTRDGGQAAGALDALVEGRADSFRLPEPGAVERAEQAETEFAVSADYLRAVRDRYWDDGDWRRGHRGGGRYPEHYLWEAVDGYLDLLDASVDSGAGRSEG